MCTVSWFYTASGYHVFFNRDESKERPRAQPPQVLLEDSVNTIMPIDPQGGGTWCAVNEHGLTYALLNFYQGRWPKGRLTSRGHIVKACARFSTLTDAIDYVGKLPLEKYAPFSLLCFAPDKPSLVSYGTDNSRVNNSRANNSRANDSRANDGRKVTMLRWTGNELTESFQACPLISSAFKFDEVSKSRLNIFREVMANGESEQTQVDTLLKLHANHEPSRSAYSVCMHREDAQTASLSHVKVTPSRVSFAYTDGAPCEAPMDVIAVLNRFIMPIK